MKTIEFKALPDETTPLNPTNLNKMQSNVKDVFDGQESMGSIVVENIECKNLFDINTENATSNGIGVITSNQIVLSCSSAWAQTRFKKIKVKQGETYTLSFTVENPSANTVAIAIYKSDNSTKIANTPNYINTSFSEHLTFTANDTEIVIALVANNSSTTNTNSVTFSNIQLEKGDTATQFVEHKEFNKQLKFEILPNVDWDNLYTREGIQFYQVSNAQNNNMPSEANSYGILIVMTQNTSTANYYANKQIYITANSESSNTTYGIFVRTGTRNWLRLSGTVVTKTS